MATERETSDNTEATRFSQCAHDQRRRLEAEDCNSIRCAQLISGGRRRIRPCPPHCLAHARPTMCCIRLFIHQYYHRYFNHKHRDATCMFAQARPPQCPGICDRHCTSNIAINISIFHLGSCTRRARIVPRRGAVGPTHCQATAHRGRPEL